jgi:hypothetical protein
VGKRNGDKNGKLEKIEKRENAFFANLYLFCLLP